MLLDVLDEELLHTVHIALAEDIGKGDITAALIPEHQTAQATIISREPAVVCGMAWFNAVFEELDSRVETHWLVRDGDAVNANQTLCRLSIRASMSPRGRFRQAKPSTKVVTAGARSMPE